MVTVEEADDVGEIHVVVDDDFAVKLDKCERYKQHQLRRADVPCRPDRLPHGKHVIIHQLCHTRAHHTPINRPINR